MKLRIREIGAALPDGSHHPTTAAGALSDDENVWHDSSMELERGLDVIDLSVDVLLVDLQAP